MGMFNFVLDSFKGEIFDFKVKRQSLIAGTVSFLTNFCSKLGNSGMLGMILCNFSCSFYHL